MITIQYTAPSHLLDRPSDGGTETAVGSNNATCASVTKPQVPPPLWVYYPIGLGALPAGRGADGWEVDGQLERCGCAA